jgi:hypothetical protein
MWAADSQVMKIRYASTRKGTSRKGIIQDAKFPGTVDPIINEFIEYFVETNDTIRTQVMIQNKLREIQDLEKQLMWLLNVVHKERPTETESVPTSDGEVSTDD